MEKCSKCITPINGSFPRKKEFTCEICRDYDSIKIVKRNGFSDLVKVMKVSSRGKRYDCGVAFSGGRDSTYTLYKLKHEHNLRCIAFFGKTIFTPNEIIESAKRTCKALNIPLVEIKIPFAYNKSFTREMLVNWMKTKNVLLSNLICCPCKLVNKFIFKEARNNDVRYLIYGGNRFEHFHNSPMELSLKNKNKFTFPSMVSDSSYKVYRGLIFLLKNLHLIKYAFVFFKTGILYRNQYSPFLRFAYPEIKSMDYFHYNEWDEEELREILHKVKWEKPDECVTTWRADCELEEIKNALFKYLYGMTHVDVFLSNLIREGKISRKDALEKQETESFSDKRLKKVLLKLELPENYFARLFK